jgi:hypothetical protein
MQLTAIAYIHPSPNACETIQALHTRCVFLLQVYQSVVIRSIHRDRSDNDVRSWPVRGCNSQAVKQPMASLAVCLCVGETSSR